MRSAVAGEVNHLHRTVLLGLGLPLANYLVYFFTPEGPWILPKIQTQLFSKMDPSIEASGLTPFMGWGPLPFWSPRSVPAHVQTGKSPLTSGVGTLYLCFSRTQFLQLDLSLVCLGENKAWILLHLINAKCPAQRPTVSYFSLTIQLGMYFSEERVEAL